MLSKQKSVLVYNFLLILIILLVPIDASAETYIRNGFLPVTSRWTKALSPYIIDTDLTLDVGRTLTIDPGVVVMNASSTSEFDSPHYLDVLGTLVASGTDQEPIRFIDLSSISFSRSVASLKHLILEGVDLYYSQSTSTLERVKMMRIADRFAITASRSHIDIKDSEISDSGGGILSRLWSPVFQVYNPGEPLYIGDIGNALGDDPVQNHITIRNSVFERNQNYSVLNTAPNLIDATNNWWGSSSGPGTAISTGVSVEPWLTVDPRTKRVECCSNVLFLPGFEASRLYRDDPDLLGGGVTTHRSWEPYTSNDVRKLFLGPGGTTISSSTVYTAEVIESAYGFVGIYKKFFAMMNSVVADKTINSWLPFAYDWRMSPTSIVKEGTLYSSTTKRLVEEVTHLAETSKSGKVTVIAHSNGGLVAKALGRELANMGKSGLVDKVVLVAVPELGTPQAIAGMLHGDSQELLKGFILPAGVARTFGLNVPGAYGLLPSREYFNRVMGPVVTIAGKAIDTYEALSSFLTGISDGRKQPTETDLKSPAVLSSGLVEQSALLHSRLDTWHFPTTTSVVSLVGWGIPTTQSVVYSTSSPTIQKGSDGDGTVVAASAEAYWGENSSDTFYFNQGLFNREAKKDISHAVILEAEPLRAFLSKIIATSSPTSVLNASLPQYITSQKPNADNYPWMSWLTISVHSPVDMDVYDSHGGHMGVIPLPADPTSDIKYFENTIGGQYDFIGDEKYYTLPADDVYTVKLKGTGSGNFTFQIQKFVGGDMTEVANVVYADLPVTPLLTGSTTITSTVLTPVLNLDTDGDGKVDIKAMPNGQSNAKESNHPAPPVVFPASPPEHSSGSKGMDMVKVKNPHFFPHPLFPDKG